MAVQQQRDVRVSDIVGCTVDAEQLHDALTQSRVSHAIYTADGGDIVVRLDHGDHHHYTLLCALLESIAGNGATKAATSNVVADRTAPLYFTVGAAFPSAVIQQQ